MDLRTPGFYSIFQKGDGAYLGRGRKVCGYILASGVNVKQNFTSLGNDFFTLYGKQIFTSSGKEFFTRVGKQFFT